ncbi:MAG: EAL domain-containing protein [Pseudomonadota bacterium]|nr:EAL domain-containing protein [Pseudomonadota bacterium]
MTFLRTLTAIAAPADLAAVLDSLSRGGIDHQSTQAVGFADFQSALLNFRPNLILADVTVPGIDYIAILRAARESDDPVPVIFVSAEIDCGLFADAMRNGADDFIFKSSLTRLPDAVLASIERATRAKTLVANERIAAEIKERFEIFMENLPGYASITDSDGHYLYANGALAKTYGIDKKALIGRSREEFLPTGVALNLKNLDRHVLSSGELHHSEQTVHTQRGPSSWLVAKFPIDHQGEHRKYVGSMSVDISSRVQAEQALNLRDRAIQVSANPILIIDMEHPDKPMVFVNDAFETNTGYSREESLGRNCKFLQGDDRDQPELEKIRLAIREERAGTALLRNYRKDGSLFLNELHIAPVRDPHTGTVRHFVGMQQDVTESKRYQAELEQQANYDSLTGLANRNLLKERLQQAVAQSKRSGRMFIVAFIDIDHFKRINDGYGHAEGDIVLKAIGGRLESAIREVDTVARLSGDEFVLLLPEMDSENSIFGMMQRIESALAPGISIQGMDLKVTCSIGLSMFPRDGETVDRILDNADIAMSRAKSVGRNNFQFYAKEMNANASSRLEFESALWQCLERDELILHYQPQLDVRTGSIVGIEALLRWVHPNRGLVSPLDFIPVAEANGMIVPIGAWVIKTACLFNKKLQDQGFPPMRVAVNLSARQLRDKNLVETIRDALVTSGLAARYLEIEITESMVMDDPQDAIRLLGQIKAIGVQMSLDDFGTGYSNMSYLKKFPIERLKIDKSFVMNMANDADDASIVRAVIALSHSLGIEVIAEGIETREVLALLKTLRCDEAQGYFFSKPLPELSLQGLLQTGLDFANNRPP